MLTTLCFGDIACDESRPDDRRGHRRSRFDPALGERVPIARGDTGISARASLPFDGAHNRRLPRLPQGSHKGPRLWRTRRGLELTMQTVAEARAKDRWERKTCGH
jgi:hypothetical protein